MSLARCCALRPGTRIVCQKLDRSPLAAKAPAAGDEDTEKDALQPGSQVRVGLVLFFEPQRALEGVLQNVRRDGVIVREAQSAAVKVGPMAGKVGAKLGLRAKILGLMAR